MTCHQCPDLATLRVAAVLAFLCWSIAPLSWLSASSVAYSEDIFSDSPMHGVAGRLAYRKGAQSIDGGNGLVSEETVRYDWGQKDAGWVR